MTKTNGHARQEIILARGRIITHTWNEGGGSLVVNDFNGKSIGERSITVNYTVTTTPDRERILLIERPVMVGPSIAYGEDQRLVNSGLVDAIKEVARDRGVKKFDCEDTHWFKLFTSMIPNETLLREEASSPQKLLRIWNDSDRCGI